MAIVITVESDPHIGPGSLFSLTSDLVGPIPNDWLYRVSVVWDPEGIAWNATVVSGGSHSVTGNLATTRFGWQQFNSDLVFPPEGTAVIVSAELLTPLFVGEDSGTRTDLLWTTQGNFVRELIAEADDPAGLTDVQAAQLAAISPAITTAFFGTVGETILRGIGDLVLHPPVGFLIEVESPISLSGRGELTRPGNPFPFFIFGATLSFFTIPAGFGFRDGSVLEYRERVIQLCAVHQLANGSRQVLTEVLDLKTDGFMWLWDNAFPSRVLYDVTPGCVVILRWLGATIPTP